MEFLKERGFLGLPEAHEFENSKFVILPFGAEFTTSYAKGTEKAPKAILEASWKIEPCHSLLGKEISGICTLKINRIPKKHEEALKFLTKIVKGVLKSEKIPIVIGGEHSITPAILKAFGKKPRVFCMDAHADFFQEYKSNNLSHACSMHNSSKFAEKIFISGVRSACKKEIELAKKKKAEIIYSWEFSDGLEDIRKFVNHKEIYLSFDFDVFDISIIGNSVGTPEPLGLNFQQICRIFDILKNSKIIGADFVEFRPCGNHAHNFLAARTIYEFLARIRE